MDLRDAGLIQIVDAALAEAARKSGSWLVCRPGCFECCLGTFEISQLDAQRLRNGLAALEAGDPERALRVRFRARAALDLEKAAGETYDEPCPALDPVDGTCDLYASRPMICRVFGPAIRNGGGAIGTCELCYEGVTEEQVEGCAVDLDIEAIETALNEDLERNTGLSGVTTVAASLSN